MATLKVTIEQWPRHRYRSNAGYLFKSGVCEIEFNKETPDYSSYTPGDPSHFVVREPGNEHHSCILVGGDAKLRIECIEEEQ